MSRKQHYCEGTFILNNERYFIKGRIDAVSASQANYFICLTVQNALKTDQFIKLYLSTCHTCDSKIYMKHSKLYLFKQICSDRFLYLGYKDTSRYEEKGFYYTNHVIDSIGIDTQAIIKSNLRFQQSIEYFIDS